MSTQFIQTLLALILCASACWGQTQPASPPKSNVREWTSREGKTLTAEYLGVQGVNVVLKLPNGKVTPVPLAMFSAADNDFVRQNSFEYRTVWQAWPTEVQVPMSFVDVKEAPAEAGAFVYTTSHFRFKTNVNLGTTLMKDLAKVFEMTYFLHSRSPLGILAKPADDLFEARLYGTAKEYQAAGGPAMTAGVYKTKEKVFMAPLDLMGVQPGAAGWRKVSKADYDPSAVVHELTHMLTNDVLDNLPVWVSEGYAEYIRCIPIENAAFRVTKDKIKQGVVDRIVTDYEKSQRRDAKMKGAELKDFLKGREVPQVYEIASVLQMTDTEWVTGYPPGQNPHITSTMGMPDFRLPTLYRTAHLILYYFIQIEGEKGVTKVRRFLDKNRNLLARYHQYLRDHKVFEEQVMEFMSRAGVSRLTDGRIQYPAGMVPPKEPTPPFTDPKMLKFGGLESLLNGESAAVVGKRIESALREDLGINLTFIATPHPTPESLPPGRFPFR